VLNGLNPANVKRFAVSLARLSEGRARSDSAYTALFSGWNSTCTVRPCVRIPNEGCASALQRLSHPQPDEKAGRFVLSNVRSND
jgi:hypothetical protein